MPILVYFRNYLTKPFICCRCYAIFLSINKYQLKNTRKKENQNAI
ncbi:hypothetical protein ACEW7V_00785 [Areca yellow leaf disease phytoplasma]